MNNANSTEHNFKNQAYWKIPQYKDLEIYQIQEYNTIM